MKMGKPSDIPGFKALLEEWNQKLYQTGFKDAECYVQGILELKRPGNMRRYEALDPIIREAKAQYYRLVAKYVAETQFEDELEKRILTLHAQGFSQARIKRLLRVTGHRCKIYYPLYRWLRAWGLK